MQDTASTAHAAPTKGGFLTTDETRTSAAEGAWRWGTTVYYLVQQLSYDGEDYGAPTGIAPAWI